MEKTPMSKAKKEFIAAIITLVTGALLLATGIIMATMSKKIVWIFGIVIIVCGALVLGIAIYELIKKNKLVKQEKKQ